ncbi:16S rRNA (cytosine(1402)-N(4))-methyltransferase RsmH [Candidatus Acetothermia bacterium]|jgi:16S rRNA (cytosine1402-N4)-methyltransferase|nr:16S rRNA (cytosine(1402)-N(4))-methyltransferase RsmH [Candidatus Acetothermia bacterium]MCI2432281.1 16S rRNA (cytosine(1402)-N(4))-methyltransferase RsmH [Candidatus Acetothermia bacterium]MCI2437406.1 16S rRNA (cytosine(1402)-N(4))-methyltransferase RsmH [Candidatus Acetothermia bacterium]
MNAPRAHQPVLLREVLEALQVKSDGIYLDGTVGSAGHARAIAAQLEGGLLIGLDCDPEALERARAALAEYGERVRLIQANFARLDIVSDGLQIERVDGILLDLGVSLTQLDSAERGLSFRLAGPLDMRLDPTLDTTAADLVNSLSEGELVKLFNDYGEERYASRIARNILQERRKRPIETTTDLVSIIERSVPARVRYRGRIHPATRVFQALRIAVNHELENLQRALEIGFARLRPNGRFVVISFHSLEDRIVKRYFKSLRENARVWGPITPSAEERAQNPRARSAKLRAACKLC